jgi:hypothetical protein
MPARQVAERKVMAAIAHSNSIDALLRRAPERCEYGLLALAQRCQLRKMQQAMIGEFIFNEKELSKCFGSRG